LFILVVLFSSPFFNFCLFFLLPLSPLYAHVDEYMQERETEKLPRFGAFLYADKAEGRARNRVEQLRNKHRQTRRLQMAGLKNKSQCVCFRCAQSESAIEEEGNEEENQECWNI
jgi:hypothetical protein